MKKIFIYVFLLVSCIVVSQAQAMLIFDTGEPIINQSTLLFDAGSSQDLAAKASFTDRYRITGFEGFFGGHQNQLTGTYEASFRSEIYVNGGLFPDSGNILFDGISSVVKSEANPYFWFGMNDIDLIVEPGDYWFAFRGGVSGSTMPSPAPNLTKGAFVMFTGGPFDGQWHSSDRINIGLRVYGESLDDSNAVPEPATMLLLGSGLMGAVVRRRKKS